MPSGVSGSIENVAPLVVTVTVGTKEALANTPRPNSRVGPTVNPRNTDRDASALGRAMYWSVVGYGLLAVWGAGPVIEGVWIVGRFPLSTVPRTPMLKRGSPGRPPITPPCPSTALPPVRMTPSCGVTYWKMSVVVTHASCVWTGAVAHVPCARSEGSVVTVSGPPT